MSQLKNKFDSAALKAKFNDLLEGLDRNNTSRMIVERYYGKLSSLEIAEGSVTPKDAYAELIGKGVEQNKARHLATASTLSEAKTNVADSYLLGRIQILESAMKELKAYSWMPKVKTFIAEGEDFVKTNRTYILIESVIRDLELDRNSKSFVKAIEKLREASNSNSPESAIIEGLQPEVWIPVVKRLYEYCKTQQGNMTGKNPKFQVSKIYSPVEAIDENTFVFHSTGLNLEITGNTISAASKGVSEDFKSLVKITESAKFNSNVMRLYPNVNSVLDITFGESSKVALNGKVLESKNVESALLASGFVKYTETEKLGMIQRAINEGSKIKDIDFGYKVTSSVFEGLSVSVFNIEDRIFIQKVNRGMKENSIVEATSATDAVSIVKEFMNYDISESLETLLANEKAETEKRTAELNKVESQIKFIIEKLSDIESAEKTLGKSEYIDQAKSLLEAELKSKNVELSKIKNLIAEASNDPNGYDPQTASLPTTGSKPLTSKDDLVPGKDYTIDGKINYNFQGYTDGEYIFNQKDETNPTPLHMKESEVEEAIKAGKITQ